MQVLNLDIPTVVLEKYSFFRDKKYFYVVHESMSSEKMRGYGETLRLYYADIVIRLSDGAVIKSRFFVPGGAHVES